MPGDSTNINADKLKAASLGRQFLAKKISFADLEEFYPKNTSNHTVDVLYNLIKNQPSVGGIYGVGIIKYDTYNVGILKLIELLENETI
jgi:hypothetical protein